MSGEASSPETILVRWKPPLTAYANGQILGYQIFYREINGNSGESVRTVRGRHKLEILLSGLKPFTKYEVFAKAFNQVGSGPKSLPILISTLEGGR